MFKKIIAKLKFDVCKTSIAHDDMNELKESEKKKETDVTK